MKAREGAEMTQAGTGIWQAIHIICVLERDSQEGVTGVGESKFGVSSEADCFLSFPRTLIWEN